MAGKIPNRRESRKSRLFRPDTPPADLEGKRDSFGHKAYATALATALLEADPPYTFGLFGPFGFGKTTVIEEVGRQLDGKAAVVVFDAWRYEGDTLRRHFLRETAEELVNCGELPRSFVKNELDKLDASTSAPAEQRIAGPDKAQLVVLGLRLPIIFALVWLAWKAEPSLQREVGHKEIVRLGLSAVIALAALVLVPLTQLVRVVTETVSRGELKPELFAQKFSTMIGAINSNRLVVVIDNLDRCGADRVEELFFTLSTFLEPVSRPGDKRRLAIVKKRQGKDAVFLIAADALALRRHLEAREVRAPEGSEELRTVRDDTGRYADDYLRKIVKSFVSMKPILADDMREYVREQLSDFVRERSLSQADATLLVELTTAALRHNPRRVKEFASNLELFLRVIEAREESKAIVPKISSDVLLASKVLLLEEEWPPEYRSVELDYSLLDRWEEGMADDRLESISGPIDNRFRAFINVGKSIKNDNLRAFLRLKQSRAEASLPGFWEFTDALIEGRAEAVEELVNGSTVDASQYAERLAAIVEGELKRGYLAGARNAIEVAIFVKSMRSNNDALRPALSLAADNQSLRLEMANATPQPVLEVAARVLDPEQLNRLAEPFIGNLDETSPERARSATEALLSVRSSLSKARRSEFAEGLTHAQAGDEFDLYGLVAQADPSLLPSSAGEKAIEALKASSTGTGVLDTAGPAFAVAAGFSTRKGSEEVADGLAELAGSTAGVIAGGTIQDVEAVQETIRGFDRALRGANSVSHAAADTLVQEVANAFSQSVAHGLEDDLLDLFDAVFSWATPDTRSALAEQILQAHIAHDLGAFFAYVEARADRWTQGEDFGWAIQLALGSRIQDPSAEHDDKLRAAAIEAKLDPDDHEEIIGQSLPVLLGNAQWHSAQALMETYPRAASRYEVDIRSALFEGLEQSGPSVPSGAFDFLAWMLPDLDDEHLDRTLALLERQTREGTEEDIRNAVIASDALAKSSRRFSSRRNRLLRDLFDRTAAVELPTGPLPTLLAERTSALGRDRKDSLVPQLVRWVRTPGPHQIETTEAIEAFVDPSADDRNEFVEALVEAETAAVGNIPLRERLLRAAIAVEGRKGSRAAIRRQDRFKAIREEQTDENTQLLSTLEEASGN